MTKTTIFTVIGGIFIIASIKVLTKKFIKHVYNMDEDLLKANNEKFGRMADDVYHELRETGFKDETLIRKLYDVYKEWHEANGGETYQSFEEWRYEFVNA